MLKKWIFALIFSFAAKSQFHPPDRSEADEPLVWRLWNQNDTANAKLHKMSMAPLGNLPGTSPDRPVRIVFWKKNMDIPYSSANFALDPSFTDCGPDVHCEISNERTDLKYGHVVLFYEQRDKDTVSEMRPWQASAVFIDNSIMSYIDGLRELENVDVVLSYSPLWADIRVDHSAGWLRFVPKAEDWEDHVEAAWWQAGLAGITPPKMDGRNFSVALFNNDCVSLDSAFGKRYLWELSKSVPFHSYGSCLHSTALPRQVDMTSYSEIYAQMSRYKLVLVWETTRTSDFVTEQIYWALGAGAVPVYYGAPNIAAYMPCGAHDEEAPCYVDAAKFREPADLAAYLARLLADEKEWERFQSWRLLPWRKCSGAQYSVLRRGKESFPCRLCKWYMEKAMIL